MAAPPNLAPPLAGVRSTNQGPEGEAIHRVDAVVLFEQLRVSHCEAITPNNSRTSFTPTALPCQCLHCTTAAGPCALDG